MRVTEQVLSLQEQEGKQSGDGLKKEESVFIRHDDKCELVIRSCEDRYTSCARNMI